MAKVYSTTCIDCGKVRRYSHPQTLKCLKPRCRSCAMKLRWKRDGHPPITCRKCGKRFPFSQSGGKSRVFCSPQCRSRQTKKTCVKCGKVFSVALSNADRYNNCSLACANEPPVFRNCETCGAEFRLNASEAKVRGRFCSFRCYRRGRGETSIEKKVRESIQATGLEVKQEHAIAKREVFDIFIPALNLLIECDGDYWHQSARAKGRDAVKDKRARSQGYRVERLSESLINSHALALHMQSILTGQLKL